MAKDVTEDLPKKTVRLSAAAQAVLTNYETTSGATSENRALVGLLLDYPRQLVALKNERELKQRNYDRAQELEKELERERYDHAELRRALAVVGAAFGIPAHKQK